MRATQPLFYGPVCACRYDDTSDRLSACNAELLSVHPYFNRNRSISTVDSVRPTSQLALVRWRAGRLPPQGALRPDARCKTDLTF